MSFGSQQAAIYFGPSSEEEDTRADVSTENLPSLAEEKRPAKVPANQVRLIQKALKQAFEYEPESTPEESQRIDFICSHLDVEEDLEHIEPHAPVLFKDKRSQQPIRANTDKITYEGERNKYGGELAHEMGILAAENAHMYGHEVSLSGNRYERTLLQLAIKKVNETLPAERQITVSNPVIMMDRKAKRNWKAYEKTLSTPLSVSENKPSPLKNTDLVDEKTYKNLVENLIVEKGKISRKLIEAFLKSANFEGSSSAAYKEIVTRLDYEGFTTLNNAGNKRIILKTAFSEAATPALNGAARERINHKIAATKTPFRAAKPAPNHALSA